jgi:molybdenum cofactor biosynthesis protein B
VATITVSDTRDASNDASGAALRAGLSAFSLAPHLIVQDDAGSIRAAVTKLADEGADAVVLTGGTGIAPRDVTIETLRDLVERTLDGFGEAFRRLSWDEVGARAILSRAMAGVRGKTAIFAVPGSPKAAALGARLVSDVLPHAHEVLAGHRHPEVP